MSIRARFGKVLRRWADRIDHHGAPRAMGRSFTFEPGRGIVFHEGSKTGCPIYYLGMDDYEKAHRDAGFDNGGILPSGVMMSAEQFIDRTMKPQADLRHEDPTARPPGLYLIPANLWDELEKRGDETFLRLRTSMAMVRNEAP